jgi:hypothetical protein
MSHGLTYYPLTNICSIYNYLTNNLPKINIQQKQYKLPCIIYLTKQQSLRNFLISEGHKLNLLAKTPIIIDAICIEICNGGKIIINEQTTDDIGCLFSGFKGIYKYGVYLCDKGDSYYFEESINVHIKKSDKKKAPYLIDIFYDLRYSDLIPISQLPAKIKKELSIITICSKKLIRVLNKWFITPIHLPQIKNK